MSSNIAHVHKHDADEQPDMFTNTIVPHTGVAEKVTVTVRLMPNMLSAPIGKLNERGRS